MDIPRTTTRPAFALIAIILLLGTLPACALRSRSTVTDGALAPQISEFWSEAEASRDLFGGPGGAGDAPDPQAEYRFVAKDTTGKSPGLRRYAIAQGRLWSVKLGPEAQSEVVVSRLLWAAGYFQPATYYLSELDAGRNALTRIRSRRAASGSRPEGEENVGRWSWSENPVRRHDAVARPVRADGHGEQLGPEDAAEPAL